MKLMPASRAEPTMRAASACSVCDPNCIVPRQIGETFSPLVPSARYSMPSVCVTVDPAADECRP